MVEHILITDGGEVVSRVVIGSGSLEDPEDLVGSSRHRRIAVFTQEPPAAIADRVAAALRATGAAVDLMTLPDREDAKTMPVVESCYQWLNGLGLTRRDLIVGVGGGALTDVTGFVAATYLRGLAAVLVPTTLLGAVDAAIGGKTAVNVGAKNLVGVFNHPERVVIDLDVLATLPPHLLREGHAEALKAGFIADPSIIDLYEKHGADVPVDEIVTRAVAVKAAVVSDDFTESGARAILNYGHTVGHAVEMLSGMSHGEAVAVGMIAAGAAAAHAVGFTGESRQRQIIESLGLPVRAPQLERSAVLDVINLDKKRDDSGLRMVLLEDFGRPVLRPADAATVEVALAAIGLE